MTGDDPLFANQWHLKNTGASAFSTILPGVGNDINVTGAWAAGITGKGIKVAIVDSGLEVAHEDLVANVDLASSYNFVTDDSDPTADPSVAGEDHGTQVAGIVAATAFNGKGGRGVAYDSRLRGYNFLKSALTTANYNLAFGSNPISSDNDVFNLSLINKTAALPTTSQTLQSIYGSMAKLRGGLGAALVQSAGNGFRSNGPDSKPADCSLANRLGVSCGDPHQEQRVANLGSVVVGALDANGVKTIYSSTGSALWISAPGGEYGYDLSYRKISDPYAPQPAIVTTARTGCPNRIGYPLVNNALVTGNNALARDCQYTAQMNGTSSAAPNVTGVIALMLQANPRLSVRDIKHILAVTARQVDPNRPQVIGTSLLSGGAPMVLDQGWVTNAAGYTYSNWYGFGAVDASAAVKMASSYSGYLPAVQNSKVYAGIPSGPASVPGDDATGLPITFTVAESSTVVERVSIGVNIASVPAMRCMQIELTSPGGTRSILLHAATELTQTSASNVQLVSNAFYGENVSGSWTLTYYNYCPSAATLSAGSPQTLQIAAH